MVLLWFLTLSLGGLVGPKVDAQSTAEPPQEYLHAIFINGRAVLLRPVREGRDDAWPATPAEWVRSCLPWFDPHADQNEAVRAMLKDAERLQREADTWEKYYHVNQPPASTLETPGGPEPEPM